jgi:hypothetical protein
MSGTFVPILKGAAIPEIAPPVYTEGRYWSFEATTKQAISRSTDPINGEYEVVASRGKLEVFQLLNGQRNRPGPDTSAELKRMIGVGQDERKYLTFPLEKKWTVTYRHSILGTGRSFWRTVEYGVIGPKEAITPAGTFLTVEVEGNATLSSPTGIYYQKWNYSYSPDVGAIVQWHYDAAVGQEGAKIEIRLTKFGSTAVTEPLKTK